MRVTGPWGLDQVSAYLENVRVPVRLSCVSASGWPTVVSLWYVQENEILWCAMQRGAQTLDRLEANPRCAFEVAADHPPYRGVRGQARATLHPDRGAEILDRLIDRYLQDSNRSLADWLRSRVDQEVAVALHPLNLGTWDYSGRMSGR